MRDVAKILSDYPSSRFRTMNKDFQQGVVLCRKEGKKGVIFRAQNTPMRTLLMMQLDLRRNHSEHVSVRKHIAAR